jgi:RNA polymerase sigma-70 factor (ECF subfamily)
MKAPGRGNMSLLAACMIKAPSGGADLQHDVGVRSAANPGGDDAALSAAVSAAQDGDEDAFRVLYRAIQPGLVRYLWVQVGEAAEDVASETWLQVARDLRKFRGDAAGFRGWVVTIARHRAVDHVRHQRRMPPADGLLEEVAELQAADDTAGSAIDAMSTRAALALIARLPRDQGEAVLLRAVMGLDAKTAAKVLGKRAGAVRTAAYRGLRGLAAYLEEAGDAAAAAAEAAAKTDRRAAPERAPYGRVTQTPASALKDMR